MAEHAKGRLARRDRHQRTTPGLLVASVFLWACGQTPLPAPPAIDFETARYTPLQGWLNAPVDLNHDGKLDLIDKGAYLVGRGDGTFTPLVPTRDPSLVYDFPQDSIVSFADMDGDGRVDAIATTVTHDATTATTVRFYRGRGDSSYEQPVSSTLSGGAGVTDIRDLDGDGRPEVIFERDGMDNNLYVHRVDASGALQAGATIAVSDFLHRIRFVDSNGDGRLDLLSLRMDRLSVYLQDIEGGFQPPVDTAIASPVDLLTGDIDGDGKLDVLVPSQSSLSVTVLLGQRRGAFLPGGSVNLVDPPGKLSLVDLDGDGRLDLLSSGGSGVHLQRGNGDGSFLAARTLDLPPWTSDPSFADLNSDGRPDLIIGQAPTPGSTTPDGITVALNLGGGRFRVAPFVVSGSAPTASAVGRFGSDGQPALLLAMDRDLGRLDARFNSGGPIAADQTLPTAPLSLRTGDLDGDGRDDAVTLNSDKSARDRGVSVSVLYAGADGALGPPVELTVGRDPYALAVGDLTNDGRADIVVCNRNDGNLSVLLAKGRGDFVASRSVPSTGSDGSPTRVEGVAIGDVNRDGAPDLVAYQPTAGTLSVYLGDGGGGFRAHATVPVGRVAQATRTPAPITLVDLNGDGKLDLVFALAPAVALGVGDGTFGALQALPVRGGNAVRAVEIADLDHDGHPDLIVLTSTAQVLRGVGDGSFQAPLFFSDGALTARDLLVADGDGDGKPDLYLVNDLATSFLRNLTP